jgi:hypothetical protein
MLLDTHTGDQAWPPYETGPGRVNRAREPALGICVCSSEVCRCLQAVRDGRYRYRLQSTCRRLKVGGAHIVRVLRVYQFEGADEL